MNNHVISNLCVLVYCLLYAEADMTEALSKVSSLCRSTSGTCFALSGSVLMPRSEAEFCSNMRIPKDGVTGYQCGVSIGFCTDQEFHDLEKAACGKTSIVPRPSSNIKTTFYNKVATINPSCQYILMHCISSNVATTVFKQQEQYCKLVNSRSMEECIGQDCIRGLYQIACTTDQSQSFSDAIVGTTQTCQDAIRECASHNFAKALIRAERYCIAMDHKQYGIRFEDCLQQKQCTKAEVNKLRIAACSSADSGSISISVSGSYIVGSILVFIFAVLPHV